MGVARVLQITPGAGAQGGLSTPGGGAGGNVSTAYPPHISTANEGSGLAAAGQGLGDVVTGLQRKEKFDENSALEIQAEQAKVAQRGIDEGVRLDDQQAATRALETAATAHTTLNQAFIDATTSPDTPPDGSGTTAKIGKAIDDLSQQALDNEQNPRGQTLLRAHFAQLRATYLDKAQQFEGAQRVKYKIDTANDSVDQFASVVGQDRTQYGPMLDQLTLSIQGLGLPKLAEAEVLEKARDTLKFAAAQNFIANNPRGAYSALSTALGKSQAPQPTLPTPGPSPLAPDATTATVPDAGAPRGIRNNNPGNIVKSNVPWEGKVAGTDQTFETFISPEAGLRAIGSNLDAYQDKHGLDTVNGIVRRWSATDQDAYVAYVSKALEVGPNDKINVHDPLTRRTLVAAITRQENGQMPYSPAQLTTALGDRSLAPPDNVVAQANTGTATDEPVRTFAYQPAANAEPVKTGLPYIDGLAIDKIVHLRTQAHAAVNQEMSMARVGLERDLQNAEAAAKAGLPVPDIAPERFYAAFEGPAAEQKIALLRNWQAFGESARAIQTMPQNQIETYIAAQKPSDPSVPDFAIKYARFEALVQAAQHVVTQREQDPLLALSMQHVAKINPLDISDPQKFGDELRNRLQVASTLEGVYTPGKVLLTKMEASSLGAVLNKSTTQQQLALFDGIRKGVGDPDGYRAIMQQIRPDAPEMAAIGSLLQQQYSTTTATHWFSPNDVTSPRAASELMLRGATILHPSKQSKAEDGSGGNFPMPPDKELRDGFATYAGDAFRENTAAARTAYQLYRYAYAGLAERKGDQSGTLNDDLQQQALRLSIGGAVDWSGHKVVTPWGMPPDVFNARFAREYERQLAVGGLSPAAYPMTGYTPLAVGDGRYQLSSGTGFLNDVLGRPVVVDVNAETDPAVLARRAQGGIR